MSPWVLHLITAVIVAIYFAVSITYMLRRRD